MSELERIERLLLEMVQRQHQIQCTLERVLEALEPSTTYPAPVGGVITVSGS
jgi:hypothetical protein